MSEQSTTNKNPQAQKKQTIGNTITVRELAEAIGVRVSELIGELMKLKVMAAINDRIDFKTAAAAAEKLGVALELKEAPKKSSPKAKNKQGNVRPPVVALLGHVDHGKTTLLDQIRKTKVAEGEAGGITQHVRAHQIEYNGQKITFLDTPGHEAFAVLREHGAHLTDVALIVVAADDGIKPQTNEAIDFAKKAGVKIVVAITKIDRPGADVDKAKKQLADKGLNPEEWGGDTIMVGVSGKTGEGIDKLLEMIMLVAEVEELTAMETGPAEGTVIETNLSKGKGTVATVLVEQGTIRVGDYIAASGAHAKVRQMQDVEGGALTSAGPSTPVRIAGWKALPELGKRFKVVSTEKEAKNMSSAEVGTESVKTTTRLRENAGAVATTKSKAKQLLLIIKADVHGSLEAVTQSLEKAGTEEARVKFVSQGLGDISESDVNLAQSTSAKIVGFNVAVPVKIKQLAQRQNVDIKIYNIIYELLDEVTKELNQLIEPKFTETKQATLEIKGVFKITGTSLICGGLVREGKIRREQLAKRTVDGETKDVGKVVNVEKDKQEVKEVIEGNMCGLHIKTDHKEKVEIGEELEFFGIEAQK